MSQRDRAPEPAFDFEQVSARAERIFQDELDRGCTDRLVNGGLEAFLRHWLARAKRLGPNTSPPGLTLTVVGQLAGYAGFGPAKRRERLQLALETLRDYRRSAHGNASPATSGNRPSTPDTQEQMDVARPIGPRTATSPAIERFGLETPLDQVRGVGPARVKALARLGLRRYGDLLWHYPHRYEYYPPPRKASELLFVQRASFEGTAKDIQTSVLNRGLRKLTVRLADSTGQVTATWLRAGFAGPKIQPGQRIAVSGEVVPSGRQVVFENPDWEPAEVEPTHTRRIVPVYPLTSGIHAYWLRSKIRQVVASTTAGLPDFLPEGVHRGLGLASLGWALAQVHFPDSQETLEAARRRLAFDELFLIQLIVVQRRLRWQAAPARPLSIPQGGLETLLNAQPFRLTGAQVRVLEEINADLSQPVPMSRLLQGEVGSGKTAVAAAALFVAAANGSQGVLMAPTEILAEQHFRTLSSFYEQAGQQLASTGQLLPRVELLTGSTPRRRKKAICQAFKEGAVDVLVGTHALIQESVEPRDLALSIVDEQHRFGVRQRIDLRGKGQNPHLLVMTATPIPRSLALTVQGDLQISTIDELPPGRQKITTHLLRASERSLAYEHVRREAASGHQAFLICPLVEGSPNLEARAATEEYARLQRAEFASLRLGLLHGRMRAAVKDDVMRQFRDGQLDVLISTSVVEVGVDIPNATVMLIEGAERFGLAQLHQFRGRVGRGQAAATCILLSDLEEGEALDRLNLMARSESGLELAQQDLEQRGPGDFIGVRQSGLPELQLASLNDIGLVEQARSAAIDLLAADPDLSGSEHVGLAARVAEQVYRVGEPN